MKAMKRQIIVTALFSAATCLGFIGLFVAHREAGGLFVLPALFLAIAGIVVWKVF
jgi:hypothetical protein